MNPQTAVTTAAKPQPKASALGLMAARLNVDPLKLIDTLKATVFRGATNDELLALVVVANEYGLNPLLKEMYAFPAKGGGIVPMIPIDGWTKIVNRQPDYDGVEFSFTHDAEGAPLTCTCTLHIKGRGHPIIVTEYFSECYRKTDPWNTMPNRMLRHKAFIQAGRLAFGFSGIHDEDEAKDFAATNVDIPATKTLTSVTVETIPGNEKPSMPTWECANCGQTNAAYATICGRCETEKAAPATTPPPAAAEPAKAKGMTPQVELANIIIEAGHNFDDFAKWGKEMFPMMPWDNISSFDEVPTPDAKRFQRAHVGLLKALATAKGTL